MSSSWFMDAMSFVSGEGEGEGEGVRAMMPRDFSAAGR